MKIVVQNKRHECNVTFQSQENEMLIMTRKELSEMFAEVIVSSNKLFETLPHMKQLVISTETD